MANPHETAPIAISNDAELDAALRLVERYFDRESELSTEEGDSFNRLVAEIDRYETTFVLRDLDFNR